MARMIPCRVMIAGLSTILMVTFSAFVTEGGVDDPSDKAANREVHAILTWLHELPKRKLNKILSGQYRWDNCKRIFMATGAWPALIEDSFWQRSVSTWDKWPLAQPHRISMKEYWDKGGLVSIHMPIPNPKNKSHQHDRDMTDEEFRMIVKKGNEINNNFLQWLDRLAKHIDWLQREGVVIFIRPFHEMNGGWFWYGKRNPEDFIKLFCYTVKYLTEKKGLHNMIVVYSANRGSSWADYYPGDAFVDIVGVDTYNDPPVIIKEEYSSLIQKKKPFALTEVGWSAGGKTPKNSRNSKTDIIDGINEKTPNAVWWLSWVSSNSPANQKNCKELYGHPLVMTRRDVDWKGQR